MDSKSIIRILKIAMISNKYVLPTPNIGNLKYKEVGYLNIIERYKDECIITGSASLLVFGLIDRTINDIDLIKPKDMVTPRLKINAYRNEFIDNYLGFYKDGSYIIDFFLMNKNFDYISFDGYKFHNPVEILIKKAEMARAKNDIRDIEFCMIKLGIIDDKSQSLL